MTKALEGMRAGTLTGDIRPWLFRVAHNECISVLRRSTPVAEPGAHDELGTADLTQRVDERAAIAQLRADLADLADRPRSALVLREFSGLSHDEIADVLETTPGAVKQTIFEARRALLDCEAGRAMSCDDIQRVLSDGDGRSIRGRKIRAHVRDCTACAAFLAAMEERPRQLAMLAPALPAVTGSALLGHVLGGGHAATGAGGAVGVAASSTTLASGAGIGGASSAIATSVGVKVAGLVAAAAVATGGGAVALHERRADDSTSQQSPATTVGPPSADVTVGGAPGAAGGATSGAAPRTDAERDRAGAVTTPPRTTPPAATGAPSAAGESAADRATGKREPTSRAARGDASTRRETERASSSTRRPAAPGRTKSSTKGQDAGRGEQQRGAPPAKPDTPAANAPGTSATPAAPRPAAQQPAGQASQDSGAGGPAGAGPPDAAGDRPSARRDPAAPVDTSERLRARRLGCP